MNFLAGRVDHGARAFVSGPVRVPLDRELLARAAGTGSVTLGVRPENIELRRDAAEGWNAGTVWVSEAMGNENLVVITAGEQQLHCRTAPDLRFDFESPVWFRFRPDRLHLFDTASTRALWP
jgi:ABC-type sugar transport system ATPase subunit